ncbi:IS110 family transposase [Butyrivibrio sp. INlla16]|uniref:IS110 family transposase n=1 Tax=Butyrivibrio sp. INlla16 TaxID=1520807 RepID=UPI00087F8F61|nr:IS110 family transposase [Butyrivibrio sp. INlla16]SDB61806.1 Transposase [Butyrivibrio sp. INlla16]
MIYVGIDVAKDKHDCCILGSDGEILFSPFTIQNTLQGFDELYEKIWSLTQDLDEIKVGLEATGHYHLNLLRSLLDNGLASYVINPLHTNLFRKGQSLRKTKTDKVDAASIAMMLLTDRTLKPYSDTSYHNEELKSLTRYRFDKVQERAKLKTSVSRLVSILFPELEKLVPTLHMASVYALLSEFPGASFVASSHLTRLKHLLYEASKGHYGRDEAISIREAAISSVGAVIPAKSMELKHTIHLIEVLSDEINEIETAINSIMNTLESPITTIPGIKNRMGAMILAEIGDFSRFENADQILAYAGLSPSTYQSGQLTSSYAHMEKRGSRTLSCSLPSGGARLCSELSRRPAFRVFPSRKAFYAHHLAIHSCSPGFS